MMVEGVCASDTGARSGTALEVSQGRAADATRTKSSTDSSHDDTNMARVSGTEALDGLSFVWVKEHFNPPWKC